MSDSTSVALCSKPSVEGLTLKEIVKAVVVSGYFKGCSKPEQAMTKMLRGRELGLGPMAAMEGLFFVKEKLVMSANLMAAVIQNSGRFRFKVSKLDKDGCVLEFFEKLDGVWDKIGASSFSAEDAKTSGIVNDTYKKFPRNMWYARAMSNGAKWFCPGIFSSPVYLPDELPGSGLEVDGETLEIKAEYVVSSPAEDDEFSKLYEQLPDPRKKALLLSYGVGAVGELDSDDRTSAIGKLKIFLDTPN